MRAAVRVGGLLAGLAVAVGLAFPQVTGLTGVVPVAQLISFRTILGLALVALAVLLFALPGRRRRLALVAVVVLAAALQGAVLAGRGMASTLPGSPGTGTLVVLAANTQARASAKDLARLVRTTGADIVVLPETTREVADDVAARLAASGATMQVLARRGGPSDLSSTALLTADRLGEYRVDQVAPTTLATFTAVPVDGSGPAVLAVHPSPPSAPGAMQEWLRGTRWVTATCRHSPGVVVAGDFNATLDHPAFAGLTPCLDAARESGAAGLGSWPSNAPRWLATPIDHVLADGRAWRVRSFAVLDAMPGSDHRPVVAQLTAR